MVSIHEEIEESKNQEDKDLADDGRTNDVGNTMLK